MPTNLPPEYFEVEKRYKAAETPAEKVETLEELLGTIPKHKGTDKLRANLRRRLAKLKATAQTVKKTGKRSSSSFHIDREGAAQILVIGSSNAGKSALVDVLTNASPEVSATPFSTWSPTPGMMPIDNIQVQLVDTPALNRDYVEPELMDLIRRADLVLIVIDLQADPFQQLEDTLAQMEEHRIAPVSLRDQHEGKRFAFVPVLLLVNKCDSQAEDQDFEVLRELLEAQYPMLPVSTATKRNLDRMKQIIFDMLDLVRIYSKVPGKEPDTKSPFVMRRGGTVEEFAGKVHQDFVKSLKSAKVWGSSAFDGQMVPRDYVLEDGDIVELRT
jgi:ribosome-interacting GTPase 1